MGNVQGQETSDTQIQHVSGPVHEKRIRDACTYNSSRSKQAQKYIIESLVHDINLNSDRSIILRNTDGSPRADAAICDDIYDLIPNAAKVCRYTGRNNESEIVSTAQRFNELYGATIQIYRNPYNPAEGRLPPEKICDQMYQTEDAWRRRLRSDLGGMKEKLEKDLDDLKKLKADLEGTSYYPAEPYTMHLNVNPQKASIDKLFKEDLERGADVILNGVIDGHREAIMGIQEGISRLEKVGGMLEVQGNSYPDSFTFDIQRHKTVLDADNSSIVYNSQTNQWGTDIFANNIKQYLIAQGYDPRDFWKSFGGIMLAYDYALLNSKTNSSDLLEENVLIRKMNGLSEYLCDNRVFNGKAVDTLAICDDQNINLQYDGCIQAMNKLRPGYASLVNPPSVLQNNIFENNGTLNGLSLDQIIVKGRQPILFKGEEAISETAPRGPALIKIVDYVKKLIKFDLLKNDKSLIEIFEEAGINMSNIDELLEPYVIAYDYLMLKSLSSQAEPRRTQALIEYNKSINQSDGFAFRLVRKFCNHTNGIKRDSPCEPDSVYKKLTARLVIDVRNYLSKTDSSAYYDEIHLNRLLTHIKKTYENTDIQKAIRFVEDAKLAYGLLNSGIFGKYETIKSGGVVMPNINSGGRKMSGGSIIDQLKMIKLAAAADNVSASKVNEAISKLPIKLTGSQAEIRERVLTKIAQYKNEGYTHLARDFELLENALRYKTDVSRDALEMAEKAETLTKIMNV